MYLKSHNSFLAAIYLRLSSDDGDKAESDSIRNQRSLLQDFVSKHSELSLKNMLTMVTVVQILSVPHSRE